MRTNGTNRTIPKRNRFYTINQKVQNGRRKPNLRNSLIWIYISNWLIDFFIMFFNFHFFGGFFAWVICFYTLFVTYLFLGFCALQVLGTRTLNLVQRLLIFLFLLLLNILKIYQKFEFLEKSFKIRDKRDNRDTDVSLGKV